MKRAILVFAAFVLCVSALAQPAMVTNWAAQAGQATTAQANTTGATLLTVVTMLNTTGTSCRATAPTDSVTVGGQARSNTWHAITYNSDGAHWVTIWYAWGEGSGLWTGADHTITDNCSAYLRWVPAAFSGTLTTADPLDTSVSASSVTTTLTMGPITVANPFSLLVSGWANFGLINPVARTGLTRGTFGNSCAIAWGTKTSTAAYSYTWTATGTPSDMYGLTVSFKPAPVTITQELSFTYTPDIHYSAATQVAGVGGTWDLQSPWPINNKSTFNIVASLYSGTDELATIGTAWTLGFSKYEGVLGYLVVPGNHDYESDSPAGRDTTTFDATVGSGRAHSAPNCTYGYRDVAGHRANQWLRCTSRGRTLFFPGLELYPRAANVTWMTGLLASAANVGAEAVVDTHAYVRPGVAYNNAVLVIDSVGSMGPADLSLPHGSPGPDNYSGADLQPVLAGYPNVHAVICGHWIGGTIRFSYRNDPTTTGQPQYGIFNNWQDDTYQASRYLLLIRLGTSQATITVINTDGDTWGTSYTLPWKSSFDTPALSALPAL